MSRPTVSFVAASALLVVSLSGCIAFNAECTAPDDLVDPDRIVGWLAEPMDVRERVVRSRETAIGNLVTDAYVDAYDNPANPSYREGVAPVDGAIENSGAIRDQGFCAEVEALPGARDDPPPISRAQLREVLPFTNRVLVVELTSAELFDVLEHSVSALGTGNLRGHFLQVSGIAMTVDCNESPYARVVAAEVGGEAVDPADEARIWRIASNDFLLREEGNDGFETLAGLQGVSSLGKFSFQVVEDYLALHSSEEAPYEQPSRAPRIERIDCD